MRINRWMVAGAFAAVVAAATSAYAQAQVKYVRYEAGGRVSWGILDNDTSIRELQGSVFDGAANPTGRTLKLAEVKLLAPAIVESGAARRAIAATTSVRQGLQYLRRIDMAVVGIGAVDDDVALVERRYVTSPFMRRMRRMGEGLPRRRGRQGQSRGGARRVGDSRQDRPKGRRANPVDLRPLHHPIRMPRVEPDLRSQSSASRMGTRTGASMNTVHPRQSSIALARTTRLVVATLTCVLLTACGPASVMYHSRTGEPILIQESAYTAWGCKQNLQDEAQRVGMPLRSTDMKGSFFGDSFYWPIVKGYVCIGSDRETPAGIVGTPVLYQG